MFFIYANAELFQLLWRKRIWRFHHGGLSPTRHRECLHFTQIHFASEIHEIPLNTKGDPSMGGCPVFERFEHVSDALLSSRIVIAHYLIDCAQDFRLVCADRAASRFESVAD